MNTALLEAVRDVFDHFLEASGEGANVWPVGPVWVPRAKALARELEAELQKFFIRQADAYAARIPKRAGKVKEADPGDVSWFAEVLSDDVAWQKELGRLVLPYITRGVQTGATETAAAFDISIDFDLADERVKKIILDRSIPFAKEVQQTTHDKVRKALAKAADEGDSIYEMRERIKKLPEFGTYRAEMVARTEVLSAMNAGEMESYALMGAAGKRWKSAHDSRTRETHRRADGQVRRLDEPFRVGGEDLEHPGDGSAKNRINCVPGDTLVSGVHAVRVYRRFYAGELVTIQTASGKELTGTPNHPVLTGKGWVAIGYLQKSDYVVSDCGVQSLTVGIDPYVDHGPVPIEDMFASLIKPGSVQRVSCGTMDFHGDGMDSYVDIVGTNCLLMDRGEAPFLEKPNKFNLEAAFVLKRVLADISSCFELGTFPAHSSYGIVGSLCELLSLLGRCFGHAGIHSLGAIARLDSSLCKMPSDNTSSNPVPFGKGKLRSARLIERHYLRREVMDSGPDWNTALKEPLVDNVPGTAVELSNLADTLSTEVTLDEIVNVERHPWNGHVYTLQTTSGAYLANGIVTHNCRCTMAPVFDEETVERERGEWNEEKGARKWEETRKEREAVKKARLEAQRKKQEAFLKKNKGKHAKSGKKSES